MKAIVVITANLLLLSLFASSVFPQVTYTPRMPKYSISVMAAYNYELGNVNGDPTSINLIYNQAADYSYFSIHNFGMQQGGSIIAVGKLAIDKKRQLRITGSLGYTMFYNSESNGLNRSKWSIFTLGAGTEYFLRRSGTSRPFVSFSLDYNLMFGGWQTNVTYVDKSVSNVYVRFLPSSRLGLSIGSGAEFTLNTKTSIIAGVRGVWANILPKQDGSSLSPYELYINDSRNTGTSVVTPKQVIYMQIYSGVNFNLF